MSQKGWCEIWRLFFISFSNLWKCFQLSQSTDLIRFGKQTVDDKLFLFAGILACLDGYMNIAMEQTEEYVNGQLKNKYGDAFIRGNNGKKSLKNIIQISVIIRMLNDHIEITITCLLNTVLYISTTKTTLGEGA